MECTCWEHTPILRKLALSCHKDCFYPLLALLWANILKRLIALFKQFQQISCKAYTCYGFLNALNSSKYITYRSLQSSTHKKRNIMVDLSTYLVCLSYYYLESFCFKWRLIWYPLRQASTVFPLFRFSFTKFFYYSPRRAYKRYLMVCKQ